MRAPNLHHMALPPDVMAAGLYWFSNVASNNPDWKKRKKAETAEYRENKRYAYSLLDRELALTAAAAKR